MGIVKKVDNQIKEIANKSVIDHSQLSNRNAYGAHSIDAIRKLPEKLTSLKDKDTYLDTKIDAEITSRIEADNVLQTNINLEEAARIAKDSEIERKAKQINIEEINGTGKLRFYNYGRENHGVEIQAGFLPDNDTLELVGEEENKKLALKGVYVDGKTIVGTGARPFDVHVEDKEIDSSSIISFEIDTIKFIEKIHDFNMHIKNGSEIQLQYVDAADTGKLQTSQTADTLHITAVPELVITDGTLDISNSPTWKLLNIDVIATANEFGLTIEGTPVVNDIISFIIYTGENELQAVAIGDPTGVITPSDVRELQADNEVNTENINELFQRVDAIEGVGGYLNPYDFDTTTPDLPTDNIVLDSEGNYDASASTLSELTQYALDQITSIDDPREIWNGTRVTNLEDNHTWILNNNYPNDFSWTDLGQALVGVATTETLGVVRSSTENLKINVDLNGEMSVNNLGDKLSDIESNLNYLIVQTLLERNALTNKYDGLKVYVRDNDITYLYQNNAWIKKTII